MSDAAKEPVKVGLFQKENPTGSVETSLGRVLAALVVLCGLGLGFYAVATSTLTQPAVTLVLGLVGLGLTGKVVSGGLEGRR